VLFLILKGCNESALVQLTNKAVIDESTRINIFRLWKLLDHAVEQSLKRRDDRVRNRWHARLSQIVGFLSYSAIRNSAVFRLNSHRKLAIGAIPMHSFDIGFDESSGYVRILLNVVSARSDAAERVVQAVFGKIN